MTDDDDNVEIREYRVYDIEFQGVGLNWHAQHQQLREIIVSGTKPYEAEQAAKRILSSLGGQTYSYKFVAL